MRFQRLGLLRRFIGALPCYESLARGKGAWEFAGSLFPWSRVYSERSRTRRKRAAQSNRTGAGFPTTCMNKSRITCEYLVGCMGEVGFAHGVGPDYRTYYQKFSFISRCHSLDTEVC